MSEESKTVAAEMQTAPKAEVYYRPSLERLRLILMFFMTISLLGFPTAFGTWIRTICGFVAPAFFMLSGYLVLREAEDRSVRIVRTVKRSALVFGILAVVYLGLNFLYYGAMGTSILPVFASKRFWFNLLFMNVWPFAIGSSIWYVLALLLAYIIIYFLDKWNLLRFDGWIALLLIVFAVITGELSGVIRWEILGYTYIPGNFLTRALPYILLGGFMHRKVNFFGRIPRFWYWLAIPVGIVLCVIEVVGLSFAGIGAYGHLIGMGIIAVGVCQLAFQDTDVAPDFRAVLGMSRWHINFIYYLCQPVSVLFAMVLSSMDAATIAQLVGYVGLLTFAVCFFAVWLVTFLRNRFAEICFGFLGFFQDVWRNTVHDTGEFFGGIGRFFRYLFRRRRK